MNRKPTTENELQALLIASQGFIARGLSVDEAIAQGTYLIEKAQVHLDSNQSSKASGSHTNWSPSLTKLMSEPDDGEPTKDLAKSLGVAIPKKGEFPMSTNDFFDRFTGFAEQARANRIASRKKIAAIPELASLGLNQTTTENFKPEIKGWENWRNIFHQLNAPLSETKLSEAKKRIADRRKKLDATRKKQAKARKKKGTKANTAEKKALKAVNEAMEKRSK